MYENICYRKRAPCVIKLLGERNEHIVVVEKAIHKTTG